MIRILAKYIMLTMLTVCIAIVIMWNKSAIVKNGTFIVTKGESSLSVAERLYSAGFISNKASMLLYLKLYHSCFRFGEYMLDCDLSIRDVVKKMSNGDVYYRKIIAIEGSTTHEIMNMLQNNEYLLGSLPLSISEGSLMPDTYNFTYGHTRAMMISRMQKALHDFLEIEWQKRDPNIPINSKQQALIVASIIEKESGFRSERPIIAGVFYNRMRRKMKLQSDPTVIYGITNGKRSIGRRLSHKDLTKHNEYNTYFIKGLPPTPIANVSKSSILAALHPKHHGFLFFVSNPGGTKHVFANDFSNHVENVKAYRNAKNANK